MSSELKTQSGLKGTTSVASYSDLLSDCFSSRGVAGMWSVNISYFPASFIFGNKL